MSVGHMTFFVLLVLLQTGIADPQSDANLFNWAYPLWKLASARWQGSVVNQTAFQSNKLAWKQGAVAPPAPAVNLIPCNGIFCSGVLNLTIGNFAPLTSPTTNVLYGAAALDLQQPFILTFPDSSADYTGNTLRFWNAIVLDMWSNIIGVTDATLPPQPLLAGAPRTLCLTSSTGPACPSGSELLTSTAQYGILVLRVVTSGVVTAGVYDGTSFALGVTFSPAPLNTPFSSFPPAGLFLKYLAAFGPAGCPYYYNYPNTANSVCGGPTPNYTAFWLGFCTALAENPLTQPYQVNEAAYVTNTFFNSYGVSPTNCTDLTMLPLTVSDSYGLLRQTLTSTPYSTQNPTPPWVFWKFNGYWTSKDSTIPSVPTDFLSRAQAAERLTAINPNSEALYYTAFTDSTGATLNPSLLANGLIYVIEFPTPVPIQKGGFWSVTLYDATFYLQPILYFPTTQVPFRSHVSGNTLGVIPAPILVRSLDVYGASIVTDPHSIAVTHATLLTATFNLIIRIYLPSVVGPSNLPTIKQCPAGYYITTANSLPDRKSVV